MRGERDAKKALKTNRAVLKEARAALKVAQQTKKDQEEARAAAQAQIAALCPAPEVDMSPDVGSSGTLVTSYIPWTHQKWPDLLARLPAGWYGFDKVVPGGGVPEGTGPMGRAIGLNTMQPCSVAWTVGHPVIPATMTSQGGGTRRLPNGQVYHAFYQSTGLTMENPAKCREWADTKIKFPEAGAVTFTSPQPIYGTPGYCTVYALKSPEDLPWQASGFDLTLRRSQNDKFSCYLGNPEEWKQRLKAQRAAGSMIDKCSKTSLWASGKLEAQEKRGQFPMKWTEVTVGTISEPQPKPSTEAGRKLCLRWVRADERCNDAIAIMLWSNGNCMCSFNTWGVTPDLIVPQSIPNDPQNHIRHQICTLKDH